MRGDEGALVLLVQELPHEVVNCTCSVSDPTWHRGCLEQTHASDDREPRDPEHLQAYEHRRCAGHAHGEKVDVDRNTLCKNAALM